MSRKKKTVLIVALVVVLTAIIGFSVNARRKDQIIVQMEKISLRDKLISKVSSTGEIKPKEYVELQSEIAGRHHGSLCQGRGHGPEGRSAPSHRPRADRD